MPFLCPWYVVYGQLTIMAAAKANAYICSLKARLSELGLVTFEFRACPIIEIVCFLFLIFLGRLKDQTHWSNKLAA